jgi:hypothetical protein
LCCATVNVGTAANNATITQRRRPIFEPGSILSVIAHSWNQDLRQSKYCGRVGDHAHRSRVVFWTQREDQQNTIALGIRTARSSVLRRTTLSKPVRGRNRFLTIEGSRLELCYVLYPSASANLKCEIREKLWK